MMRVWRLGPGLAIAIGLAAVLMFAFAGQASAGTFYASGSTGYDVSVFQCGATQSGSFGVVSVTSGRSFTHNSCLTSEFADAAQRTQPPSLYMNTSYPAGTTASRGLTGPKGQCAKKDKACQAYNYGYNNAADAVTYAASQGATASVWWLDVETANTWSKTTSLNRLVVQGAIDYLQQQAGLTVGVYSTGYQWGVITGGMQLAVPNWVAGASSLASAPARCSSPFTGSGGSVWLVQYRSGAFDGDYAC